MSDPTRAGGYKRKKRSTVPEQMAAVKRYSPDYAPADSAKVYAKKAEAAKASGDQAEFYRNTRLANEFQGDVNLVKKPKK